ncbi:unnamed protein product [Cyprideis torosa]|uniref:Uncharacterized protein n=1 Tax=Cyprideis torosa TaxID=163714 RepID=A0A7R8WH02_9CRUS|nr:unnamed protein product [Cyprideis torosa]CAG0898775.1 unnamed protein product [Cyprideis torosa]
MASGWTCLLLVMSLFLVLCSIDASSEHHTHMHLQRHRRQSPSHNERSARVTDDAVLDGKKVNKRSFFGGYYPRYYPSYPGYYNPYYSSYPYYYGGGVQGYQYGGYGGGLYGGGLYYG